jgi:hypothetical protein
MYRDKTNVEYEMYAYIGRNGGHRKSDKSFKEKFGNHTRKVFSRFTTKDIYIRNVTNTQRTVLHTETWSLTGGDHRSFKRSTNKKGLWTDTT